MNNNMNELHSVKLEFSSLDRTIPVKSFSKYFCGNYFDTSRRYFTIVHIYFLTVLILLFSKDCLQAYANGQ